MLAKKTCTWLRDLSVSIRYNIVGVALLKNVREMDFKDILPKPMSRPVAAPQGPILVR